MAPVRANTLNDVSPVSNALAGLVRLVARQAARECAERWLDEHASTPTPRPGEAEMNGQSEYLRARDIARLTGVSIGTARTLDRQEDTRLGKGWRRTIGWPKASLSAPYFCSLAPT